MNYIVDPMWFYWISVIDCSKLVAFCLDTVCFIGAVVSFGCHFDAYEDDAKKLMKWCRIFLVAFAVLSLLLVFVPSKSTLIEMMIARTATKQNAEMTLDAIKSAVDYVSNAIQSAK
jgi:hypothetical protein